ncbi:MULTISPECIES: hypothetical protein [Lysinibacillus]|uniref:hypothetical protein n=1 Tax=Lysinibacillus TaxID=400634 RepID=UPI00214B4574|nr:MULTISPECIES: hypothetical protein [Lysinibacillus]MED3800203.1 hypothetical protein [Lysinibacillus capsici]UUV26085.1 hypothetical protein NP781_05570 [Lysinibacillus sp. FN11]UYB48958.1 hypothetical protein OCI51_08350 [Lysinibacillus capsici]
MSPREEMKELFANIAAEVNHGECFYASESFKDFCITIDLFKSACRDLFESNQE